MSTYCSLFLEWPVEYLSEDQSRLPSVEVLVESRLVSLPVVYLDRKEIWGDLVQVLHNENVLLTTVIKILPWGVSRGRSVTWNRLTCIKNRNYYWKRNKSCNYKTEDDIKEGDGQSSGGWDDYLSLEKIFWTWKLTIL